MATLLEGRGMLPNPIFMFCHPTRTNVSLKGIFLLVPEVQELNSEIEIVPLDSSEWSNDLTGQVVRIDVDQATSQPAIGAVLPLDDQWPRFHSATGRLVTSGSMSAEIPTDGAPMRRPAI